MAQIGKFVAYYRVSTDKQGKSGLGLEAQRQAIATYLNGGDRKIISEFTEVESGKRADRPQLDAALKAARLHRAAIVSRLLEANVDVRFADLPQIEGPTGRFMLQQMASVAELEAGMIFKRTKGCSGGSQASGHQAGRLSRPGPEQEGPEAGHGVATGARSVEGCRSLRSSRSYRRAGKRV